MRNAVLVKGVVRSKKEVVIPKGMEHFYDQFNFAPAVKGGNRLTVRVSSVPARATTMKGVVEQGTNR